MFPLRIILSSHVIPLKSTMYYKNETHPGLVISVVLQ